MRFKDQLSYCSKVPKEIKAATQTLPAFDKRMRDQIRIRKKGIAIESILSGRFSDRS
jgi:hypothetical protein